MFKKLNDFFELLNAEFPLETMGKAFKGSHAIFYKGNQLQGLVWWNGHAYTLVFQEDDFNCLSSLLQEIRRSVDAGEKKKLEKEC